MWGWLGSVVAHIKTTVYALGTTIGDVVSDMSGKVYKAYKKTIKLTRYLDYPILIGQGLSVVLLTLSYVYAAPGYMAYALWLALGSAVCAVLQYVAGTHNISSSYRANSEQKIAAAYAQTLVENVSLEETKHRDEIMQMLKKQEHKPLDEQQHMEEIARLEHDYNALIKKICVITGKDIPAITIASSSTETRTRFSQSALRDVKAVYAVIETLDIRVLQDILLRMPKESCDREALEQCIALKKERHEHLHNIRLGLRKIQHYMIHLIKACDEIRGDDKKNYYALEHEQEEDIDTLYANLDHLACTIHQYKAALEPYVRRMMPEAWDDCIQLLHIICKDARSTQALKEYALFLSALYKDYTKMYPCVRLLALLTQRLNASSTQEKIANMLEHHYDYACTMLWQRLDALIACEDIIDEHGTLCCDLAIVLTEQDASIVADIDMPASYKNILRFKEAVLYPGLDYKSRGNSSTFG